MSGEEWSECAKKGLAVKTKKGDALLFYRWHLPPFTSPGLPPTLQFPFPFPFRLFGQLKHWLTVFLPQFVHHEK